MVTIQLQADHFYLITNLLGSIVLKDNFDLVNAIKVATTGKEDTDLCDVSVDVQKFTDIFQQLSRQPEGVYNRPNTEMMDLLTPQIEAGVQAGDPEWIQLATNVTAIRNANFEECARYVAAGKEIVA